MAIYKSNSGSSVDHRLELRVTHTQDIPNNKSTLNYELYMTTSTAYSNNWHSDAANPYYLKIGDTKVWTGGGMDMRGKTRELLTSGSKTFTHNADGNLTVPIFAVYDNSNLPISDQIYVRRLEINISYKLPQIKRGIRDVKITPPNDIEGAYKIEFTKDRPSAKVKVEARRKYYNQSLWSNPKTYGTDISSGFAFNFFNSSDRGIYAAYPDIDTIDVEVRVISETDGYTQTFNQIDSLKMPDVVNPSVDGVNWTNSAWQQDRVGNALISDVSLLTFEVNATSRYSANIVEYQFKHEDESKTSTTNQIPYQLPAINGPSTTFKFRVKDTRARYSSWHEVTQAVMPYIRPKINMFFAKRVDPDTGLEDAISTTVEIGVSGEYASIKQEGIEKNNVRIDIDYLDGSTWRSIYSNYTATNRPYMFGTRQSGVGIESERTYRVKFTDYFNRYIDTRTVTVPVGYAPLILGIDGIGVGKAPTDGYALDLQGQMKLNGKDFNPVEYEADVVKLTSTSGKATLTFKQAFANQPALVVTSVNSYNMVVGVPTINNDSATLRIRNTTSTGSDAWYNGDVYVSYIAIGKR